MDETIVVNTDEIDVKNSKEIIKSIISDLEDAGYNAYKQVTEYLLTGEVGYISSYKEARNRIEKKHSLKAINQIKKMVSYEKDNLSFELISLTKSGNFFPISLFPTIFSLWFSITSSNNSNSFLVGANDTIPRSHLFGSERAPLTARWSRTPSLGASSVV